MQSTGKGNAKNEEEDARQQADRGLDSSVTTHELEVKWNVVDGEEENRSCTCCGDVEENQGAGFEEGTGECSTLRTGEKRKILLGDAGDEHDSKDYPHGDAGSRAKCPGRSVQGDGHDEQHIGCCQKRAT